MKIHLRHNHGLGLVALLIIIGCILVIGGAIVVCIANLARKCLPPTNPPNTNSVAGVEGDLPSEFYEGQQIVLPNLQFPTLPANEGQTATNPFGYAKLVIERSTNLISWEEHLVITNAGQSFNWQPNPMMQMEFFRGRWVTP